MSVHEENRLSHEDRLDPVTFEVLKNGFSAAVESMSDQVRRTCYSFTVFNGDFSSCLCDRDGNLVSHGRLDLSGHIATMHNTCKAVIAEFGDDIHPGDAFVMNDAYAGNTHWNDIRVVLPVFHEGKLIAFTQSSAHWADIGGNAPGSFDVSATSYWSEALRITPIRLWSQGRFLRDIARMIMANVRVPSDSEGDLNAQYESTLVGKRELLRLVDKYGVEDVLEAFSAVQDYVERFFRARLESLPDGSWESIDYLDQDYGRPGDGLIPIKMKMIKEGTQLTFDLTGTAPTLAMNINAHEGSAYSAICASLKLFFPEIPLNSGFFRVVDLKVPDGTLVSAKWPVACTGHVMTYEKLVNSVQSIFSKIEPSRAMACSFNLDYLLIGGYDRRIGDGQQYLLYDWLSGGWGGHSTKDGRCYSTLFGISLKNQPVEGQERLSPTMVTQYELAADSAGPGKYRGGMGIAKGYRFTDDAKDTIATFVCNRARAVVWGDAGGLPSCPVYSLHQSGGRTVDRGPLWANVRMEAGDTLHRPSGGGGGYGDPLERDPKAVLEDVIDEYVSTERARTDYGVVVKVIDADLCDYRIDADATKLERERIRMERHGWLEADPEPIVDRFQRGEIGVLDLIRQYGIILDWDSGSLLPNTTAQYRELMKTRSASAWK